jgi:2-dehydropantoate 2-reductase
MMPAAHLVPGRVAAYASPIPGLFDIGLASGAVDTFAGELATRLGAAGFDARAVPDVMRWKYTKLLMNLGNAVEALCGLDTDGLALVQRARAEGEACLRAAGIDYASAEEERRRRGTLLHVRTIDGARRGGGSSWQSLARGLGSIEADALNGEIVRIGAATGVPTPVNDLVCTRALAAAARRAPAASVPASELLAELGSSG